MGCMHRQRGEMYAIMGQTRIILLKGSCLIQEALPSGGQPQTLCSPSPLQ